jgi:hypothetical protein
MDVSLCEKERLGYKKNFALHKVENIIIFAGEQTKGMREKSVNLFYLHSQSLESTSIIN